MLSLATLLLFFSSISLTFCEEENVLEKQVLHYVKPSVDGAAHFSEAFHDESEFNSRWKKSEAKKDGVDEAISKYNGVWAIKEPKENPMLGDNSLVLVSEAKHAAISTMLDKPFKFENKPLIVQYEVRFQNTHECGGAYIKLLSESPSLNLKVFNDKTPYTIMFGPDKCGGDSKIHFIFQHEDPITHKMEEKHAKKSEGDFSKIFDDKKTHLMTLIVRPDNSFEILVDKVKVNEGSLLTDMEPPVNPPKEIDDPEDIKPDDWDEREKIIDSTATKPEDWDEDAPKQIVDTSATKPSGWLDDEPELIADPAAVRPSDWDDVEDGEWEAPQISNPKCKEVGCGKWQAPLKNNPDYKGKWTAPLITNPNYKGVWAAKKIPNPNYFEDLNPFAMKPIVAVGFELWSMQSDIAFDNLIVSDDDSIVNQWTLQTWQLKYEKEVENTPNAIVSLWSSWIETTNEKPWLWVVAAFAILLPIVLIYIFCFPSKDSVAERKKTDAVVPDEEPNDSNDSADEEKDDSTAENKNSDSSLKEKTNEDTKKPNKLEESEEEEKEVETVEDEIPSPSPRTRARRKTRKE
ncbi:calnexin isoform X1 [Hydra vulgaris]|uniref:Calnexin n=1 Tax=Hydra vulgaris TaxID=6087 RepID=T2MGV9_HYDVU|nr:calnexin [Hydra vulgaris]